MGQSSLMGIQRAPRTAAGRDTKALGPGDSSDSGADLAGAEALDRADPGLPVDVAMNQDVEHALVPAETLDGDSDSAGTGERRSAASDAGIREAADISVDRIVPAPGDEMDLDDDEDPDLAFVDALTAGDELDVDEEEEAAADASKPAGKRPAAAKKAASAKRPRS